MPEPDIALTYTEIDRRLSFDDARAVMELDFRGLHLHDSTEVNAIYDRIEERIDETGEPWWFFLIDYGDTRIDQESWFAFARRGKALNLAHSMGTVRFDPTECTRAQMARDAGTEAFDPNLFDSREAALAKLARLPNTRMETVEHRPTHSAEEIASRISFDRENQILEMDLSDYTFSHTKDVDDFEDHVEQRLAETDQRWWFLINYAGTEIDPSAWVRFANRGKKINEMYSLGSVRFGPGLETETDIRLRASSSGFRPNIRNTRKEALVRIDEMKAERRAH